MTAPTLAEIRARIQADMQDQIPSTWPSVVGAIGYVYAAVVAAAVWGVYQFGAWVYRQMFADTASDANMLRIAAFYGITPVLAVKWAGTVTATGTSSTAIPSGTKLTRLDGVEYESTALATIGGGGTVAVSIRAVVAGEDGNFTSGTLTWASAITGLDSEATFASTTTTGDDEESADSVRIRLLNHLRTPPQGGATADYEAWVRAAVADVSEVFVYPQGYGPGTVGVVFTLTDADPIPDSGQVAAAQAYVEARTPVTATATVSAPTAQAINMTLAVTVETGYVLADVQDAIELEIQGEMRNVDIVDDPNFYVWQIYKAAAEVPGVKTFAVTTPSSTTAIAANSVPTLGTVTWV